MIKLVHIAGILLSLGYWLLISLWSTMPIQIEWGFCIFLLASLGIPHGAADHLVAQKLAKQENKNFNLWVFIGKYLAVMLLYGILWYYFPLLSFILFIALSVFHFGDLETTSKPKMNASGIKYVGEIVRSFILGIGILGFILSQHQLEVDKILQNFNLGVGIPFYRIPTGLYILCFLIGYQKEHRTYFIHTGITLLIGTLLPILPAFMCYFAGCHAMYSIRVLSLSLNLSPRALLSKLLPFTLLALIMGFAYLFLVSREKWLAHAFIFLSFLTLPHFFLMHQITPQKN